MAGNKALIVLAVMINRLLSHSCCKKALPQNSSVDIGNGMSERQDFYFDIFTSILPINYLLWELMMRRKNII